MTTTVTVKARAWGAKVVKGEESFELGAHEDRTFHLDENESLSVAHGDKPLDEPTVDEALLTKTGDEATTTKAPDTPAPKGFGRREPPITSE